MHISPFYQTRLPECFNFDSWNRHRGASNPSLAILLTPQLGEMEQQQASTSFRGDTRMCFVHFMAQTERQTVVFLSNIQNRAPIEEPVPSLLPLKEMGESDALRNIL